LAQYGAVATGSKGPPEKHAVDRLGWLRAAVLGANDGVLSTSSLIIGVASAHAGHNSIIVAGLSGLVAGAMSMSAGEFVSVSSQADSEHADLARERAELKNDPAGERNELAGIYVKRGLNRALALQVAEQLMAHDALGAHSRDELGISDSTAARPIQAALTSAAAFAIGAALPLTVALVVPAPDAIVAISVSSLIFLALLGVVGAKMGGANILTAAVRVTFWGALAMAVTAAIGALFGAHV
jgi:VIT1/CCC1 family predicted Fe2+/Mn2+ transporter